jgi:hypothetical protein
VSLAGEEGVPPLLSDEEGEEREERVAPPHAFPGPDDPDVPKHNAADDPPDDEEAEDPPPPPVSPPPLPDPEE